MSGRPTIPSLQSQGPPSQQSLSLLESRLLNAEDETRHLLNHLGSMGDGRGDNSVLSGRQSPSGATSPFRHSLDPNSFEMFRKNYDALVSRVCKTESVLQSLKLNFLNVQGDRSLSQHQTSDFKEKLQFTREAYEQEIGKLTRQIEMLKDELLQESDSKESAVREIQELQLALDEASTTRIEAKMASDSLTASRQKSQRRLEQLKDDKEREMSLRASLEESHNTLLSRVQEVEAVVEKERKEVNRLTHDGAELRSETEKLREDLKEESRRKQVAESSYKMLVDEKEKLLENYHITEKDRQMLMSEVKRLREQYEELITQMEQTKCIIDKQEEIFLNDKRKTADKISVLMKDNTELATQCEKWSEMLKQANTGNEKTVQKLKSQLTHEKKRYHDYDAVQEEALRLKESVTDLDLQNTNLKRKFKRSEEEVRKLKAYTKDKDEEFTTTADSLEGDLSSLRLQLQHLQKDKEKTLKDKEQLLEEVNQTVDGMAEERIRLQTDNQQIKLELDSHGRARKKLEHENAHLLERLAGFEQQQKLKHRSDLVAQKHIENTLKEMMDQKNKLAYENGRLLTQVEQTAVELENLRKADLESAHYRKISDTLQNKYAQAETEISELKITIERCESQLKQAHSSIDSRSRELSSISETKEDLQKENQKLLTQLQASQEREKRKVRSLQKNVEDARSVNKEIAGTLESVMSSHSQLQSIVENLQSELGKKDSHIARLKNEKSRSQAEWKTEIKNFEERMESLRQELTKERDKTYKKTNRDMIEIKKQNDNLSTRNMELMKSNTEMRQKTRDMEVAIQELKEKVGDQKRKMDYHIKTKKDLEENIQKMKGMKSDIVELERLRDTYMKKNKEQADMISTFMEQINSLQTELRQLATVHSSTHDLVRKKEHAIFKERNIKEEMERKYKETKLREDEIARMKLAAEKQLADVHDESLEISGHLNNAHEWFKDKFDNLQSELSKSRRSQEQLEKQNNDQKKALNMERRKAQEAADKAKEMIQASRQTINRLSDYADLADQETQDQLQQLYQHLQLEKDHSKYLEKKHQRYTDSSARQFEQILRETNEDSSSP